jgi:hypothetical protein
MLLFYCGGSCYNEPVLTHLQQLAAPKSKYVEHILIATHAGEQGVAEVFRVLQNRLRDSTWTIVFKSLIIVHFMIREGEPNVTLRYLASGPERKLAVSSFTEGTHKSLVSSGLAKGKSLVACFTWPKETLGREYASLRDICLAGNF